MAAPMGNNYWQFRGKHGRDFKYTPDELWIEAVKYFKWMKKRVWNKKDPIKSGDMAGKLIDVPTEIPFSLQSFCLFADISTDTFRNYENTKDFIEVTTRIRSIVEAQQFEGATVGAFNPNIIARTLGLTDKTDITTNGKDLNKEINLSNYTDAELRQIAELQRKGGIG